MFYEITVEQLKKIKKEHLEFQLKIVLDEIETTNNIKKQIITGKEKENSSDIIKMCDSWLRKMRKHKSNIKSVDYKLFYRINKNA